MRSRSWLRYCHRDLQHLDALPDVRILEYAGVSTLDKATGASGYSATASTNSVSTSARKRAALRRCHCLDQHPGSSDRFHLARVISGGGLFEDRIMGSVGTYNAAASLSTTASWAMQR